MPPAAARSRMARELDSSHCSPKVMVPRQSRETGSPVRPRRTYCITPPGEDEPRAQYHREGTQSGVKVYDPAHDRSGRWTPMTRASLLASAVALVLTIAVALPAPISAAGPEGRSE